MKAHLAILVAVVFAICSSGTGQTTTPKNPPPDKGKPVQDTPEQTIMKNEKGVWTAVKDKLPETFGKYLADDYVGVYSDGVTTRSGEAKQIAGATLKEFSFAEMKVFFPQKNTAVITYKITMKGDHLGKDFSGVYAASSV